MTDIKSTIETKEQALKRASDILALVRRTLEADPRINVRTLGDPERGRLEITGSGDSADFRRTFRVLVSAVYFSGEQRWTIEAARETGKVSRTRPAWYRKTDDANMRLAAARILGDLDEYLLTRRAILNRAAVHEQWDKVEDDEVESLPPRPQGYSSVIVKVRRTDSPPVPGAARKFRVLLPSYGVGSISALELSREQVVKLIDFLNTEIYNTQPKGN